MKKIFIIVLCFVLLNKATAQADKIILDNVFQNIDKTTIPTGYLQDYGVAFVNKEAYNGILTDSNAIANLSAFRLMYNDLLSAKINPAAPSMASITTINSILEPLQNNVATPLIFNISSYAGFEPDALLDGKVTFSNNQIFPVAGQNPWITHRFFAACPINQVSPTVGSLSLTFNSSLVYSNCGKQISTVAINFYDGAGYQALASGGTVTQTYNDSSGYKPFAIKVVCTDGSVYECYSLQYVHVSSGIGARFAASNIQALGGTFPNTAPTPHNGTMQVIYSRLRQGTALANQLVKPLIIINGLDETDVNPNTPASLKKNLRKLLNEWNDLNPFYDFNGQLDDLAGYDLIYINYYTLDKIEHNADMLISMLNWINANKAASAEQNVVMGIGLGGLISRYALAKMTRNSQPHQTRLLLTHDAPHQGAYMPLGYQHLAEDFGGMDYWGTSFKSMISDYQRRDKLKQTPVFLQFYLHRVDGATVSYNSFLAPTGAYQTMVNFAGSGVTPTYQFVATSQGSQCGTQVMIPGTNMLKYEEKIDDDPFAALPSVAVTVYCFKKVPFTSYCMVSLKIGVGFGVAYKTKLSMSALPNIGNTKEITYAAMEREIFVKIKVKVCVLSWCVDVPYLQIKIGTGGVISQGPFQRFNPPNILPYESFAGSTDNLENFNFKITGIAASGISWSAPLWKDLATYLGLNILYHKLNTEYNVIYGIHTYSYISRVSALDIANPVITDYTKLLALPVSGLNRSRASKFICHEVANNGGITAFNLASGRFTKSNAKWMFNEMQGIINNDYCYSECYNQISISGPPIVCSHEVYTLPVPPTGLNVTWALSPAGVAALTVLANNQVQINTINNNNGIVTLTATIGQTCSIVPPIPPRQIQIGRPVIPAFTNTAQVKQMSQGVWNGIVKFIPTINNAPYQWKVNGIVMPNSTGPSVNFSITDCNGLSNFYQDYTITASAANACGTNERCAVYRYSCSNSGITKTLNYFNPCNIITVIVNRPAPTRFVLSEDSAIANHLEIDVATLSEDHFAQLYPDADSLNTEMVQTVSVYDVEGNLVQQADTVNAKQANIDLSGLPEGNYNVVVGGNNHYTEQQTYKHTVVKSELQLAEEIATGNYTIPTPDEADRKEVLKQQLFKELLDKQGLVNASTILQNFLATKDQENYGFIRKITEAFDNGDTAAVSVLLNQWVPQNQQDQNCIDYFNLYLRLLANDSFAYTDINNMYDLANRCPLKDGEIIYAARSLYNFMTESSETFEYACNGAANRAAKRKAAPAKGRYLPTTIKVYPNPAKGSFNIDFPAMEKGQSTITMTDVYGKKVLQKTISQRLNNISLPTGIASGNYVIQVTNQKTGKQQTQKIVVKS